MDATKVLAGLKSSEEELTRLGYGVQRLTDFSETADRRAAHLSRTIVETLGRVRTNPSNFILFEKLVNVVHSMPPGQAVLHVADLAAAVKRWL
jgi:hypothetical protein